MVREGAQGAVAGGTSDGGQPGNGQATTTSTPQGEPLGTEAEDFVLSEETVHKLPPRERAIASRALRLERELAELRATVARGDIAEEPDPAESASAQRETEIQALLDELIPNAGYETLAPGLKKLLGGLIRENEELREKTEKATRASVATSRDAEFKRFKRENKGWEKWDEQMASTAKKLGLTIDTQDQLEELLNLVRGRDDKSRLEAELDASRKAGPVPSMRAPAPTIRERLATARAGGKAARNVNESFMRHFPGAVKQAGQGQP